MHDVYDYMLGCTIVFCTDYLTELGNQIQLPVWGWGWERPQREEIKIFRHVKLEKATDVKERAGSVPQEFHRSH